MTSVAIQIMAHPQREDLALRLAARLNLDENRVTWDRGNHSWETGSRAWRSLIDSGAEWACVVQDDAIVCEDFAAGMSVALDQVPNGCLVAPFNTTGDNSKRSHRAISHAVERADTAGASWIAMPVLMGGLALAMRTDSVSKVMTWCDEGPFTGYDRRIGQYFLKHKQPVYSMHPSLADHRDDEPSLTGHGKGRVAHRFIGEEASALDVDWSGTVTIVPGTPQQRRRR